ncbi:hypothetical protein [Stenotrophomonas bentonitica]|uniref:hypothetical protein n=1 Tax=Stenotrophomonas bentonitica TaxID=1450134 RepID=UPI0031BBBA37
MNTERTEKFVNAIACDLEEGGFRQVSGTTLRRTLATAVSAALPLLEAGNPVSGLAKQQGVELPPLPASRGFIQWHSPQAVHQAHGFTSTQMQDYARAALVATGKQQVGEVQGDESPMAKMAAALRGKAEAEKAAFDQRVQSGEWGPMPDAGTQADFCQLCDGSGWDGESREKKCQSCSGEGLVARQPGAQEPVAPKKMERAVALDLLHAVYKHHGWKRAEGESMTARVHEIYNVTLDAGRNRYVAIPKNAAPPAQGIDLGRVQRWDLVHTEFGAGVGHRPNGTFVKLADVQALIDQRDAAPGVGNG